MRYKNPELQNKLHTIDQYIQNKKKEATTKPVYTEVARGSLGGDIVAHLVSYPNTAHAKEYVVRFAPHYFRKEPVNKLERVASHELAHIRVPFVHDKKFKAEEKRLGGKNNGYVEKTSPTGR
jgi:predicted SprT family Zn-dependent metalloprotease